MAGGDLQPIIFSLMVPQVSARGTTKRLQERPSPDNPGALSPVKHCSANDSQEAVRGGGRPDWLAGLRGKLPYER